MRQNHYQLKKEIVSLDMIIAALSFDLSRQRREGAKNRLQAHLIKQMKEALSELRRRRGQRRLLLKAIEKN